MEFKFDICMLCFISVLKIQTLFAYFQNGGDLKYLLLNISNTINFIKIHKSQKVCFFNDKQNVYVSCRLKNNRVINKKHEASFLGSNGVRIYKNFNEIPGSITNYFFNIDRSHFC